MASLLSHRAVILPPAIRTSIYQFSHLHSRRHASTITSYEVPNIATNTVSANPNPVAEWIMSGPSFVMDAMHNAGLPWWAVIPISALIVRGGILYKYNSIPVRRKAMLRRHLAPVQSARMRRVLMHQQRNRMPGLAFFSYIQTMMDAGKLYNLRFFDGRVLISLGALVTMTETIRVKCGSREGLLGVITYPLNWLFGKNTAATTEALQVQLPLSSEEILAQRLFDAREAQLAAATKSSSPTDLSPEAAVSIDPQSLLESTRIANLNTNRYADFIEPSMQTEGIAWLSDLTLPDPTFTLPALLTLTMVAGVLFRPHTLSTPMAPMNFVKPSDDDNQSQKPPISPPPPLTPASKKKGLENSHRIGIIFSLFFGAASTQFPAAVLLYLVPNMTIAWLQTRWMDVVYPMPGVVEPCKRPVRYKVRKEFEMPT